MSPTAEYVDVHILRKNGCDGVVTVDYETKAFGDKDEVALPGVHYQKTEGTLIFQNQQSQ